MEMLMPLNRVLEEMKINDYLKNNIIYLDCEIDRESQVRFCRELRKLAEQELAKPKSEQKPVTIRISSFGGWVCAVFAMVSYMEYWQEKGLVIVTIADGYTASGGSKVLMAGSKGHRYITRYGTVLFHQSGGYSNAYTLQEKINELKYSIRDWEMLKGMIKKHTKLTEQELIDYTEKNVDFTYYPEECVEKSIVDQII